MIFSKEQIIGLPDQLKSAQSIFNSTGGLHASGLFNSKAELISAREDVGRHNALDKIIGQAFQSGHLPLNKHLLLVSGRLSYELVQKASMAGIQILAAIGAPSSLAYELAKEMKLTLIGFLRDQSFNVYTGFERII